VSGAPKYIIGELVELGTPAGSEQPRALIHCHEGDIAAVKYVPLLRRVAIVPLEELNGSDVPPIVAENRSLRAACREALSYIGSRNVGGEPDKALALLRSVINEAEGGAA
jgi:hypothetical protein